MDFDKSKIEITWSGYNIGMSMKEGRKNLKWEKLTRDEQVKILNTLAQMYGFFYKFLKEE